MVCKRDKRAFRALVKENPDPKRLTVVSRKGQPLLIDKAILRFRKYRARQKAKEKALARAKELKERRYELQRDRWLGEVVNPFGSVDSSSQSIYSGPSPKPTVVRPRKP